MLAVKNEPCDWFAAAAMSTATRPGRRRREATQSAAGAEIIKSLDRDELTVRAAHARTGIAAADFSRIRNADLARFTVDRLVGSSIGSAPVSRSK